MSSILPWLNFQSVVFWRHRREMWTEPIDIEEAIIIAAVLFLKRFIDLHLQAKLLFSFSFLQIHHWFCPHSSVIFAQRVILWKRLPAMHLLQFLGVTAKVLRLSGCCSTLLGILHCRHEWLSPTNNIESYVQVECNFKASKWMSFYWTLSWDSSPLPPFKLFLADYLCFSKHFDCV